MKKLELFVLNDNDDDDNDDDDTWVATYNGEEAHNIRGDSIEDKLQAAATVWGLELERTEIEVLGIPWWEGDDDS